MANLFATVVVVGPPLTVSVCLSRSQYPPLKNTNINVRVISHCSIVSILSLYVNAHFPQREGGIVSL